MFMSRNKNIRNALLVTAAVGAGVGVHAESKKSVSSRVGEAQQQIIKEAAHNTAHPPKLFDAVGGESMAAYEAPTIAQEAKGAQEAKELTAKKVAKLSFKKAFAEASDIGLLVTDVSDRTSVQAKKVLELTLPESSVTGLESRNIHFIYDSVECNPFIEGEGKDQVGYIPLTVGDAPIIEVGKVDFVNSDFTGQQGPQLQRFTEDKQDDQR
jgi:hypothetical protein